MAEGIRIEGLPELKKIMEKVGSLKPVKRALAKGATHLRGEIRVYPKQRPSVNPKWFYKRGEGSIYLPTGKTYKTSEKHSKSWTGKSSHGGLTWTIGSNTSYGRFLQDERRQTVYHQETGWKTTEDVVDAEERDVVRFVQQEVNRALEGR